MNIVTLRDIIVEVTITVQDVKSALKSAKNQVLRLIKVRTLQDLQIGLNLLDLQPVN